MDYPKLPLDQLRLDEKANVRKIGRGADNELIASIKAIGLLLPLIVRPNGKGFVVADGGKRLEALHALVKSGDLPKDTPVPVIVHETATDAEAREISLSLNLIRTNMHPVDAFRAFSSLHTDKTKPLDVDAIATRFGIDTKTVRQRLALGALHDDILNAWRDGEINAEVAQAFTLCPDKKEQAALYDKLKKDEERRWNKLHPSDVRQALKAGGDAEYLDVVGAEAYEARGGKVTRDLFGNDHVISDSALLETMINEKLAETCQWLVANGWKWATSEVPNNHWEFGRLPVETKPTREEAKRLKALEEALENEAEDETVDYDKLSAEHDALQAEIARRGFTEKQKAEAGCFVQVSNGAIQIDYGRTEPAKTKVETVEKVNPITGKTEQMTVINKKPTPKAKGPAKLTKVMDDRLNEWRRRALKAALNAGSKGLDSPVAKLIAGLVAAQIHPESKYNWAAHVISDAETKLVEIIEPKVMNAALRKAFDAKAYFEGAGKTFCLAAITEAVNADEARKVAGKKKGEIAKFALANVGKTGWLPKELRTAHYDGPTKQKAKKGK